jgi:tRNA (mo5U34)-methyltransferase
MTEEEARALVASRPHWYHRFEIFPGVVTPGVTDPTGTLAQLDLPARMDGWSVLEIGPADGFFTRALAERGAEVTAVDYFPKTYHGFAVMERLAGREFNYIHANLYDLPSLGLAPSYDLVLALGVLYHLPDPLRALWLLRQVTGRRLVLETLLSDIAPDQPVAALLPGRSCNNDPTNFWAPNALCMKLMLREAGFIPGAQMLQGDRGLFQAIPNPGPTATEKMRLGYATIG